MSTHKNVTAGQCEQCLLIESDTRRVQVRCSPNSDWQKQIMIIGRECRARMKGLWRYVR